MHQSLEHQSPQFAVDSKFESFSALKHACTRAALLDVYEFVPDKVNHDRYALKCKNRECAWYLYATAFPGTDVWRIRKTIQLILVTASNTLDTATSTKNSFQLKFSPSSVLTRNLLPTLFRIISKNSMASPSLTPKQ